MTLTKTWQNTIITPIPTTTDPSAIISILHDHGFLITMSPIVTGYEEQKAEEEPINSTNNTTTSPGDDQPTSKKITYLVHESIPLGLFSQSISFTCSFQNMHDGVVSWIQAPMGLTSKAEYRVRAGEDGALEERIESECNFLLKGYVERTMVRTRTEMHGRILEKAAGEVAGEGDVEGRS